MLYAVLLLVLAALGLLVPALTSASTLWAWLSVAASAAAAVGLVVDWRLHRRSGAGAAVVVAQSSTQDRSGDGRGGADQAPAPPVGVPAGVAPQDEPAEEDTDAADLLAVAEAPDEVRVLDERPRYHLAGCSWVGDRAALGLPLAEARELGFTPCGVCRPDSALAATKRAAAKRAGRAGADEPVATGAPDGTAAATNASTERAVDEPERAVLPPQAAQDAPGAAEAGAAAGSGDEPAARG
ncbi:hypothetical protein APASM_5710 [Actinosynnema pretiosum subsp. pretiosum]|nr:hypothetical protein APASM_5710 [Actinosynnema pretiosum subsp. pretiosum]